MHAKGHSPWVQKVDVATELSLDGLELLHALLHLRVQLQATEELIKPVGLPFLQLSVCLLGTLVIWASWAKVVKRLRAAVA